MSKFPCLVLSIVAVSLSSVYARTDYFDELTEKLMKECSDDNVGEYSAIQSLTIFPVCEWSCFLKKTGFMDDKGRYTPNAGQKYIKKLIVDYDQESNEILTTVMALEPIAKKCELVNDIEVSDGSAGCERVFYLTMCMLKNNPDHGDETINEDYFWPGMPAL